jgi:hypothetical protein
MLQSFFKIKSNVYKGVVRFIRNSFLHQSAAGGQRAAVT